jgi:hypothetical protein
MIKGNKGSGLHIWYKIILSRIIYKRLGDVF